MTNQSSSAPTSTAEEQPTQPEKLLLYAAELWRIKTNILAVRLIIQQFSGKNNMPISFVSNPMMSRFPYRTAPKDGRFVVLGTGDGEEYVMRWEPDAFNPLFGMTPGLWVLQGGGMTWCDRWPDGAPEYWRFPADPTPAVNSQD